MEDRAVFVKSEYNVQQISRTENNVILQTRTPRGAAAWARAHANRVIIDPTPPLATTQIPLKPKRGDILRADDRPVCRTKNTIILKKRSREGDEENEKNGLYACMSMAVDILLSFLPSPNIIYSLTLINKEIFKRTVSYVNLNFNFLPYSFQHYSPRRLIEVNNLEDIKLCPNVSFISFASKFNLPIPPDTLPPSLNSIKFCGPYSHPLPQHLYTHIWLDDYNNELANLPNSLTFLSFKNIKNKRLDNLPPFLTHLEITGRNFNGPLDHLPPSLTHLKIYAINCPLDSLPSSLLDLELDHYSLPLDHLPHSLLNLKIHSSYYPHSLLLLPSSLLSLSTPMVYMHEVSFPPSLTHLTVPSITPQMDINTLPSSLLHLSLEVKFESGTLVDPLITHFPPKLTHLSLVNYNKPLPSLPLTLTHLSIKGYRLPLPDLSHTQLVNIIIHSPFNELLPPLPASLKYLAIGKEFDQPITNLPSKLSHLTLTGDFDEKLDSLPASLTYLRLGDQYSHSLSQLPARLEILDIADLDNAPSVSESIPYVITSYVQRTDIKKWLGVDK